MAPVWTRSERRTRREPERSFAKAKEEPAFSQYSRKHGLFIGGGCARIRLKTDKNVNKGILICERGATQKQMNAEIVANRNANIVFSDA